jgi:hypothetical protein
MKYQVISIRYQDFLNSISISNAAVVILDTNYYILKHYLIKFI